MDALNEACEAQTAADIAMVGVRAPTTHRGDSARWRPFHRRRPKIARSAARPAAAPPPQLPTSGRCNGSSSSSSSSNSITNSWASNAPGSLIDGMQEVLGGMRGHLAAAVLVAALVTGLPQAAGAVTNEQLLFLEAWRAVDRAYVDKSFNGQSWFRVRESYLKQQAMTSREETYTAIRWVRWTLRGWFYPEMATQPADRRPMQPSGGLLGGRGKAAVVRLALPLPLCPARRPGASALLLMLCLPQDAAGISAGPLHPLPGPRPVCSAEVGSALGGCVVRCTPAGTSTSMGWHQYAKPV